MKIKMRTLASGPDGVLQAGKVYNLPDATAIPLVEGGYAQKVDEKTPALVVETPVARPCGGRREKATIAAPETATEE